MSQSKMRPVVPRIVRILLLLAQLLLTASLLLSQETCEDQSDCRYLQAGQHLAWHGGGSDCYLVAAPAGILIIEATTAATSPVEPVIGLAGKTQAEMLVQTPGRLVLAIARPGTVAFSIASQDPSLPLDQYTLTTRVVETGTKDEDEGEVDPILSPMRAGDDHADSISSAMATPLVLGHSVTGELVNSDTPDLDTFSLSLSQQLTVIITSSGNTDTFGSLYHNCGYRLAADDNSGAGSNFRISKTLVPGQYLLRIEGWQAAEGTYSVHAEAVQ